MKQPDNSKIVPLLSIDEAIVVIIGIVILNVFVYKYLRSHDRILTTGTKFVICMCFGCLTMLITGVVEFFRQEKCPSNSTIISSISNLSIYAKLPQDITMGIAQLFALSASLEFAYFVGPRSARSLFMSLHFCSIGVASYICDAYISALTDHSLDLDFRVSIPNYHIVFSHLTCIFICV